MAMATEQRKTRGELLAMFWHDFAGTIADNMVEVNWMVRSRFIPGWSGVYQSDPAVRTAGLQTWVF